MRWLVDFDDKTAWLAKRGEEREVITPVSMAEVFSGSMILYGCTLCKQPSEAMRNLGYAVRDNRILKRMELDTPINIDRLLQIFQTVPVGVVRDSIVADELFQSRVGDGIYQLGEWYIKKTDFDSWDCYIKDECWGRWENRSSQWVAYHIIRVRPFRRKEDLRIWDGALPREVRFDLLGV